MLSGGNVGTMSKSSSKQKTIRRVALDLHDRKKKILIMIIIISAAKICLSLAPRVAGKITDYLSRMAENGETNENWFIKQCVLLAFLYFIGHAMDVYVTKSMVGISQSYVQKLRNKAQKKINHMHISYLDNHPIGDVLSRLTNDMITLSNGFESTIPSLVGQVVLLVSLFVVMIISNWMLALIYIILFPVGMVLMRKITKRTSGLFKKQNAIVGEMNGLISDTYSNHTLTKAYSCENEKKNAFIELNKKFKRTYVRSRFLSGLVIPLSIFVNNGTYVCLCIIGGILLIHNKLTIGGFLSFILYGNMVGIPMTSISNSLNNIQNALSAASRIYDFLDEEELPAEENTATVSSVNGEVRFANVKFGYVPDKILMKNVSFTAPQGSFSAIVGPSGAGKTTLVNLLMRFYEINDGNIYLDSMDTRKMSRSDLRQNFGMVLQDTWIFDGTIAENISYGKQNATMEEITEAAKKAQCHDFISRLAEGYNTHISEEHSCLSAGEKQLIAIARTILSNPQILILDEATSQVDTRTEYRIVKAMEELTKGRTTFMIAHRLFTIRNADQIMYMENGDILEVGNHDKLMAMNGRYASLYRS